MKILYLDCFAGISGDMLLGALIDLGVSEELLRSELAKLKLPHYSIATRRALKQTIAATKFDCQEESHHHHEHRGFTDIAHLITNSSLPISVKNRAISVFRRLGEAEAKVHGIPLDKIHFHEIGAVDSIVDIVGVCIALDLLGISTVQASPLPCGSGFVETAHGKFPVPAPATLELLRGIPVVSTAVLAELVTPTGAALLAEFCTRYGAIPPLVIEKIGYGAGTRDLRDLPNVLRAVLGQPTETPDLSADRVATVEPNIDDMNPEFFGDLMDRLIAPGVWDVS